MSYSDPGTVYRSPKPCCPCGSSLDRVPYFIVYLRDIADYPQVDAYMRQRFPHVPRVILEARVCRPTWLIEMECEVAPSDQR